MTEGSAKRLGFDEEKWPPEDEECVVDGVVLGLAPVLSAHVVEITKLPAERRQHGLDEDRLGILLTNALAALGAPLMDDGIRRPRGERAEPVKPNETVVAGI